MTTFADLGVRSRTLSALTRQGIVEPLPVQEAALPALLAGRDGVVKAPTGLGKTLAFAIPLVEHLDGMRAGERAPSSSCRRASWPRRSRPWSPRSTAG